MSSELKETARFLQQTFPDIDADKISEIVRTHNGNIERCTDGLLTEVTLRKENDKLEAHERAIKWICDVTKFPRDKVMQIYLENGNLRKTIETIVNSEQDGELLAGKDVFDAPKRPRSYYDRLASLKPFGADLLEQGTKSANPLEKRTKLTAQTTSQAVTQTACAAVDEAADGSASKLSKKKADLLAHSRTLLNLVAHGPEKRQNNLAEQTVKDSDGESLSHGMISVDHTLLGREVSKKHSDSFDEVKQFAKTMNISEVLAERSFRIAGGDIDVCRQILSLLVEQEAETVQPLSSIDSNAPSERWHTVTSKSTQKKKEHKHGAEGADIENNRVHELSETSLEEIQWQAAHARKQHVRALQQSRSNKLMMGTVAYYSQRLKELSNDAQDKYIANRVQNIQLTPYEKSKVVLPALSRGVPPVKFAIDLHTLTMVAAEAVTEVRVSEWWAKCSTPGKVIASGSLAIIIGQGIHSANGRSKLYPMIRDKLAYDGWIIDKLVGVIVVYGLEE